MKTASTEIPEALHRFLHTASQHTTVALADYVAEGARLVTPEAIAALRDKRLALRDKIRSARDSQILQRRLDVLVRYFEETLGEVGAISDARREVTFALLYLLKGYDRIPDSIPEIGLLDDAMVVDAVLDRHSTTLRGHWLSRGRPWPERI